MVKQRNSNIEFLRIISMLAIIAFHMFVHTGFEGSDNSIGQYVLLFFSNGGRIGVNIFLFIGIWYMTERNFSAKRSLELYLITILYSTVITFIAFLCGQCYRSDLIRSFMPYNYALFWFTSAYITLQLISPLLNKALALPRKQLLLLIFVTSLPCTIYSTLKTGYHACYQIDVVYFWIAYLFIGYIKLYLMPVIRKSKASSYLLLGTVLYAFLVYSKLLLGSFCSENVVSSFDGIRDLWLRDIKSLPNILIAFCFFFGVMLMKPRQNKFICQLSKYTFDVYTIHTVPVLYNYPLLYINILHANALIGKSHMVIGFLALVCLIYIAGSLIGAFRDKLIFPLLRKSRPYLFLLRKTDEIYQKCDLTDTAVSFPDTDT